MVAISPFVAKGIHFNVPPEFPTEGRGSGRAKAFVRGVRAASRGAPETKCPFSPGRGSGSFRLAWLRGHESYHAAKEWRSKR